MTCRWGHSVVTLPSDEGDYTLLMVGHKFCKSVYKSSHHWAHRSRSKGNGRQSRGGLYSLPGAQLELDCGRNGDHPVEVNITAKEQSARQLGQLANQCIRVPS
eukprot:2073995-Pleurochrysis_carterae.AAC.1